MSDVADLDRQVMWHPFTQMAEWEPLVIAAGDGNYLIDRAGRRYLDGVSSLWCNVHGHRHPRLDRALRDDTHRRAIARVGGRSDGDIVNPSTGVDQPQFWVDGHNRVRRNFGGTLIPDAGAVAVAARARPCARPPDTSAWPC
jgi:hypothetical protein